MGCPVVQRRSAEVQRAIRALRRSIFAGSRPKRSIAIYPQWKSNGVGLQPNSIPALGEPHCLRPRRGSWGEASPTLLTHFRR